MISGKALQMLRDVHFDLVVARRGPRLSRAVELEVERICDLVEFAHLHELVSLPWSPFSDPYVDLAGD